MFESQNLGLVRAIHVGVSPPENTSMIWRDTSQGLFIHKAYNNQTQIWVPLTDAELPFDGDRPVTTLPAVGVNYGGTSTAEWIEAAFFAALAPLASLSIQGGTQRELGGDFNVVLNWVATKRTNDITSIIVDSEAFTPTGNTQSGVKNATATQDVNTTFLMQVSDGDLPPVSSSVTLRWLNQIYWGTTSTFADPTDVQIRNLNGAGVGSGSELSTTKVKNYNGINGAGDYLVFAWPSSFGNPTFLVNGLPNTAFTKIRDAQPFTNQFGYISNYDVWVSNTIQNSPITLFQIN